MNVQFKCFQCEKELRKEIHSYSINQDKEPFTFKKKDKKDKKEKILELCNHFSKIELNWTTKWGFFTLGWQVKIYNVRVKCKCKKCPRWINFATQTFKKGENSYEEPRECCDNIIVYSAHEGYFDCSNEGKRLQENINKQIEEIKAAEEENKKLKEEKEKLEKEEKLWKEKEEEERREREEEEKKEKEKENRRRSQYEKENKEMLEIIKQQEKEEKELNQRINIDTSWIEEQMSQMITEANTTYSKKINFNAQKAIKANFQIQKGK